MKRAIRKDGEEAAPVLVLIGIDLGLQGQRGTIETGIDEEIGIVKGAVAEVRDAGKDHPKLFLLTKGRKNCTTGMYPLLDTKE